MRVRRAAILLFVMGSMCVIPRAGAARTLIAERWRDLSPKQRYETLQNYWRHQQLPADRQREIEQRYQRWRDMSPDERSRIQQNYERFRQLQPQERERFQRKYDKWRQQGAPQQ